MGQVTIMSGVERRRRWTEEQKQALVTAISQPGANIADIARRADLRPGQIYRWRRQMLGDARSEEHTSELQSLMRISYAVFCLKKKNKQLITRQQDDTYNDSSLQPCNVTHNITN